MEHRVWRCFSQLSTVGPTVPDFSAATSTILDGPLGGGEAAGCSCHKNDNHYFSAFRDQIIERA